MSLLASNTCKCCSSEGIAIENGLASSLTEAGPRLNRWTIARRVGSDRAWKTRSRLVLWLGMCLSMADPGKVCQPRLGDHLSNFDSDVGQPERRLRRMSAQL